MPATPLLIGIGSTVLGDTERRRIERLQPAGYVLLERNLETPSQTRALTDSLRDLHPGLPPIIAIAEEGGEFTRLENLAPRSRSPAELAGSGKPTAIAENGAATGQLLGLLGVNLNLAPLLDLQHRPDPTGGGRRWHRDPQRVIDHAGMWNRWLRRQKIRSAAKYFPAGGREQRERLTITELLAEDIVPYTALMPELDAVVVGHQDLPAIDPGAPASLSRKIVTGLLRDQLGFDRHLVLTDDLGGSDITSRFPDGSAFPASFRAGVDLAILAREPVGADEAAARLREVPAPLLQDAERRIERFRQRLHPPLPWSEDRWSRTCEKRLSG